MMKINKRKHENAIMHLYAAYDGASLGSGHNEGRCCRRINQLEPFAAAPLVLGVLVVRVGPLMQLLSEKM